MIRRICIIGYGTISKNIIQNLNNNSYIDINVWSRTNKFSKNRITVSDDIKSLLKDVDLILSCVPDDEASTEVWNHPVVVEYIKKYNVYCMEMSTLSYSYIMSWHKLIEKMGGKAIECPFTKSRAIDSDKSISAFLYTKFYIEEISIFMNYFCNKIYFFKEIGESMKFKLIYNTWGAEMMVQLREMYKLIEKQITSTEVAWDILCNDGWMSLLCSNIIPKVKNKNSDISFKLKYMKKDVDYSEDIFKASENELFYLTQKKFDDFVNDDNCDEDFSIIVD